MEGRKEEVAQTRASTAETYHELTVTSLDHDSWNQSEHLPVCDVSLLPFRMVRNDTV